MKLVLFILAVVCFALAALRVNGPLDWTPAGFSFLTLALFLV